MWMIHDLFLFQYGVTPLHVAAATSAACTIALLDHGANVDAEARISNRKFSPLHFARDAAIAAVLVERGANVNASDGVISH